MADFKCCQTFSSEKRTDREDAAAVAHFAMLQKDSIPQPPLTQDPQKLSGLDKEIESPCQLISTNKIESRRLPRRR
jgi:hypothetical protein